MTALSHQSPDLCKGLIVYAHTDDLVFLDCKRGSKGVVVEEYILSGRKGWTILFENGESDGFSEDEAFFMLFSDGAADSWASGMKLNSRLQLRGLFDRGVFDSLFANAKPYEQALAELEKMTIGNAAPEPQASKKTPRI